MHSRITMGRRFHSYGTTSTMDRLMFSDMHCWRTVQTAYMHTAHSTIPSRVGTQSFWWNTEMFQRYPSLRISFVSVRPMYSTVLFEKSASYWREQILGRSSIRQRFLMVTMRMVRRLSTPENRSASIIPTPRKRTKTVAVIIRMIKIKIRIRRMAKMMRPSRTSSKLSTKNRKMFSMLLLGRLCPRRMPPMTRKKRKRKKEVMRP